MKKILFLSLIGCLFRFSSINSQSLDSLERLAESLSQNTETYLTYCEELSLRFATIDFMKSKYYAFKGLDIADKRRNLKSSATLYMNLGITYTVAGKHDSASLYLDKALSLAKKTNDEKLEALVAMRMATLQVRRNNFKEALSRFFEVLPVFEKNKDKENMKRTLANIAVLYMYQENFSQAEKYYVKVEKICQELNDSSGLGQAYQGLSRIELGRGRIVRALEYAGIAAKAFHTSGETAFESVALKEMALIHLKNNNIEKAASFGEQSLQLAKKSGNNRYIANSLAILSDVHFKKGNYQQSMDFANASLMADSTDLELKTDMLANLIKCNMYSNKPQKAIDYFSKYKNVIDKRANESFQQSLSEMEVKYDTEKKQLRIASLEKNRKITLLTALAGAAVLLMVIMFLFYRQHISNHKKEKAEHQVIQLEREKQLVAAQAVLDGETAERTRLARDLHDSLGGMLSVIKLNLYDVKKGMHLDGEDLVRFNQALEMLETSAKELRRVAHNMMPEALSRFGLKTSLKDFIRNIPNAYFHYFGEDQRLEPKMEAMIYRSASELVNNALKHAEAGQINVQLLQHPDSISLTVQDDGKGFDTTAISDGHGLQNIRNRVESFGGTMNIFSQAAEGTEINLEFKNIKPL